MRARVNVLRAAVLAAAVAMLALPASANAAEIHFDQVEEGGTIAYDGSDYVGTDIIFEQIAHNGVFVFCGTPNGGGGTSDSNCLLDFDTNTGAFVVTAENGLYDSAGVLLPGVAAAPITVLTGTSMGAFGHVTGIPIFAVTGTDTKLAELLEYFGILDPDEWIYTNTEIHTGTAFVTGVASTKTVNEADIVNTIPEPGLLALFGLGLVGLGRQFTRRRK